MNVIKNVHLYQQNACDRVVRSATRSRLCNLMLKTIAILEKKLQLQNEGFDTDNVWQDDVDERDIDTSDVESDGDHHSVPATPQERIQMRMSPVPLSNSS